MFARALIVGVLLSLGMLANAAQAVEPIVTEGRVSAVTVYQGQALVTRELDVPNAQGLLELVVTNLPVNVLPASLFAEPTDGVQVRSVRYRARPIEEDVRKEVRELDEQIQDIQDQIAAIVEERGVLRQRKGYLTHLENFTAATSQTELKSGVLNAETLKDLTQFVFSERDTISQRELELAKNERARNKQKELLTRKRETIAAGSSRTVREAVVFINVPKAGDAKLRLSYLVSNASWSPSYNVRASQKRDEVTIEYNASIQQMSGEDWNDVDMILSTATPSLVATAPELSPLRIKLGQLAPPATPALAAQNYKQVQDNLMQLDRARGSNVAVGQAAAGAPMMGRTEDIALAPNAAFAYSASNTSGGAGGGGMGSWDFSAVQTRATDATLNRFACELQILDFNSSLSEIKSAEPPTADTTAGVSVSYQLANRTSLPSRSDRQLIQIASVPLKADFYKLATPVLTNFVYEEARLTNSSDRVFLAGPVATFVGGQFVGRGSLPTVTRGETFTVGLGIDSSLRAARELVKKDERVQGGNRVVDFTYELSLENFGGDATKVRLLDRLPTVGDNDDIKVTLLKSDVPVSDDATYQMADRKDGILRWDVEVPAQAIGPKRKVLRYTMQIEYDKQLSIVGGENQPQP